jgi:uncharacterized protein (TIGR03437 family)
MRKARIRYWLWPAFLVAPILTAQHLQFAANFGGACVSETCTGSYGWIPDTAAAIAADSLGNTYVTGTSWGDFPLVNAIEPAPYPGDSGANGWHFPFVAKIDPTGTKLIYATPIGGLQGTAGGVAVDSAGNAYVTGGSQAAGFPGISGTPTGGAFLIKLDPNGKLLLSILFGGTSGNDLGTSIALDQAGGVYITGVTLSPDFPITSGAYLSSLSGTQDLFLTKIDGKSGRIQYSTFLGPGDSPQVALGAPGDVFIAANTTSTAWPTTPGVVQPQCRGTACADVIVLKLRLSFFLGTLDGSGLVYATYLGGSDTDYLGGITSDASGSVYLSGTTNSTDFPVTPSAVTQTVCTGDNPLPCGSKAFVAHLNPSGTALEYATYLGGNGIDIGRGIAIDTAGDAYVTGQTTSTNFPAVHAVQAAIIPGVCFTPHGDQDSFCGGAGFLTVLNPEGNAIVWSTFLGQYSTPIYADLGSGFVGGFGVAVDAANNVYVAGSDLAVTGTPLNSLSDSILGLTTGEATALKIAPGGQPLMLSPNSLVNAASYAPGLPFAGGLASVFVSGLTGINGITAASGYPLQTKLAGVSVKVNGELAPILAVASLAGGGQQINFQVPLDRGLGQYTGSQYPAVEIDANGVATFTGALPVAPGIFTLGDGSPAVEHAANFTLVTKAHPVVPGEIVSIYATGLGAYTPGQTGMPPTGPEPSVYPGAPTVSLGGTSCTVLYAGPAPGYVGLDQINCRTSKQTPAGMQPLQIISQVGAFVSNTPTFVTNSNIVSLPVQ